MSEDVVDFGPAGQATSARTLKRVRPAWITAGVSLPLAAVGAALGAASCVGEWQSVQMPAAGPRDQSFTSPVSAVGPLGTVYLVVLVGLVTAAALALFSDDGVRKPARIAGIALSGSGLVLLAATANTLTQTGELALFQFYPAEELGNVTLGLEWGLYAAMGAMAAIGGALVLNRPPLAAPQEPVGADEPAFEGEAIDLTVTVEPIAKQRS